MSSIQNSTDPIRITESSDGARAIVLHPENDDLFVQTGRQVIEACRLNISLEVWQHEVGSMFARVRNWAAERAARVQACYVSPRHTKLLLFVAPKGTSFDFDLADELVQLNRDLLRDYQVGMIELLQVPANQIDRFMSPVEGRVLYAQPG